MGDGLAVSTAGLLKAIYPIYLGLLLVVALAMLFSTLTSSVPWPPSAPWAW